MSYNRSRNVVLTYYKYNVPSNINFKIFYMDLTSTKGNNSGKTTDPKLFELWWNILLFHYDARIWIKS